MNRRVVGDDIDTRRMTTDTIGMALDHHVRRGTIKAWYPRENPRGDRWIVIMAGTGPFHSVEARTKREIGILLAALISAEQAVLAAIMSSATVPSGVRVPEHQSGG